MRLVWYDALLNWLPARLIPQDLHDLNVIANGKVSPHIPLLTTSALGVCRLETNLLTCVQRLHLGVQKTFDTPHAVTACCILVDLCCQASPLLCLHASCALLKQRHNRQLGEGLLLGEEEDSGWNV